MKRKGRGKKEEIWSKIWYESLIGGRRHMIGKAYREYY
jgi:hypothetical protein